MFAALFGRRDFHPRWDPDNDAYSLFTHRALAMGWSDDEGEGLWSMNDAGWEHPGAQDCSGLVSWFQVEAHAVSAARPLPVQPLLRCGVDATARACRVELDAVQLLLPLQGLAASRRGLPSLDTAPWFAGAAPDAATSVDVTLDIAGEVFPAGLGDDVAHTLAGLDQEVFTFQSCTPSEQRGPSPLFDDDFWDGPSGLSLRIRGDLAEWSVDAVGWLAETLADCLARLGVRASVVLTITREPGAAS